VGAEELARSGIVGGLEEDQGTRAEVELLGEARLVELLCWPVSLSRVIFLALSVQVCQDSVRTE
jgi:hypothetical protein